ncbi:unnamed protein product [Porites evermanni]|uniref:Uncharacterized protein n=1 Tax=Porites evermanni TaxID=104178 RepID=A0ABN8LFT6_9CNID|nr:unnamed protein product [Porites evermanni]
MFNNSSLRGSLTEDKEQVKLVFQRPLVRALLSCCFLTQETFLCAEIVNAVNTELHCLVQCRKDVCERLGLSEEDVKLSMGMSSDFDKAILMGSTNVRVGSTFFSARQPKQPSSANAAGRFPQQSPREIMVSGGTS